MKRLRWPCAVFIGVALGSSGALADAPAASAAPPAEPKYATCVEHIPAGATRPTLREVFPEKGFIGYALPLEATVEHGGGEQVLPYGFSLQASSPEAEELRRAGFELPVPEGGSGPKVERVGPPKGDRVTTHVIVPLVALPRTGGSQRLSLPPLPIAVARANGEIVTLCTQPHAIDIAESTANAPDARPAPNPMPRRQREVWVAAERAAAALVAAIVGGLIALAAITWWRRRPKPVLPAPPRRPAWQLALEQLAALYAGPLLIEEQHASFVDRVSYVVRQYLGERFGFDGLEATSHEVRRALRRVTPPPAALAEIDRLLDECDLVKFASITPSRDDCEALWALADTIVRQTMPAAPSVVTQAPVQSAAQGGAA